MKKQILVDDLEQLETKEYTKLTPMLVPETWEELKELCKSIKGIKIFPFWLEYREENHTLLCFTQDGAVVEPNSITSFAEKRTPQQMWNIIKNLIGEK